MKLKKINEGLYALTIGKMTLIASQPMDIESIDGTFAVILDQPARQALGDLVGNNTLLYSGEQLGCGGSKAHDIKKYLGLSSEYDGKSAVTRWRRENRK